MQQKVDSLKKKRREKKQKSETIPVGSTLLSTRLNNNPIKNLWRLRKFEGKLIEKAPQRPINLCPIPEHVKSKL